LTIADNHPTDPRPFGTDTIPAAIKRVQSYFKTEAFRCEQPFAEAIAVIQKLSQRYVMVVVTARDEIIEQATRDWLDRHFPSIFKAAYFTAHYSLTGQARRKADVLIEAGADYFIDDSLSHILDAAEAGFQCILFGNYPWTDSSKLPSNAKWCQDWAAVLEYFDGRDS
jgi:uncharacterized HAD superfamily protein